MVMKNNGMYGIREEQLGYTAGILDPEKKRILWRDVLTNPEGKVNFV